MRLHLRAFLALFAAACHQAQVTAPSPRDRISELEYDLFAAAILHETGVIYIPDSTVPYTCEPSTPLPTGFVSICDQMATLTEPVAWTAFLEVNRVAFPISPAALTRRGVQLQGPRPKDGEMTCPAGPSVVLLSRAAFNHDSTMALLNFSSFAGRGGSLAGCGYAGGLLALYEWTLRGGWKRSRMYMSWIS